MIYRSSEGAAEFIKVEIGDASHLKGKEALGPEPVHSCIRDMYA